MWQRLLVLAICTSGTVVESQIADVCLLPAVESDDACSDFSLSLKYSFNVNHGVCRVNTNYGCGKPKNLFDNEESCLKKCFGKDERCDNVKCDTHLYQHYYHYDCTPKYQPGGCCPSAYYCRILPSSSNIHITQLITQGIYVPQPTVTRCTVSTKTNQTRTGHREYGKMFYRTVVNLLTAFTRTAEEFNDVFVRLLKETERDFHQHYQRMFGLIYMSKRELFTDLFRSLQEHYSLDKPELENTVHHFWRELHQYLFTVFNSQYRLDDEYLMCAGAQVENLKPFGDVPEKLSVKLKSTLMVATTFTRVLIKGRNVMAATFEMMKKGTTSKCSWLMNRLEMCPDICLNITKTCLAHIVDLGLEWDNYTETFVKFLDQQLDTRNFKRNMKYIKIGITDAIMNFQEKGYEISQEVFGKCGRPRTGKRHIVPEIERDGTALSATGGDDESSGSRSIRAAAVSFHNIIDCFRNEIELSRRLLLEVPEQMCSYIRMAPTQSELDDCQLVNLTTPIKAQATISKLTSHLKLASERMENSIDGKDVAWDSAEDSQPDKAEPLCFYRYSIYDLGEEIPDITLDYPCKTNCTCQRFSENSDDTTIVCTPVQCTPFELPSCIFGCKIITKPGECCPSSIKCDEDVDRPARCSYEGINYMEGDVIRTSLPCKKCICTANFTGPDGPGCSEEHCVMDVRHNCVPIYDDGSCCPVDWRCPGVDRGIAVAEVVLDVNSNGPQHREPASTGLPKPKATWRVLHSRCLEPRRPGRCKGAIPSFHFSPHQNKCLLFNYTGCEGNDNRFDSLSECLEICTGRTSENSSDGPPFDNHDEDSDDDYMDDDTASVRTTVLVRPPFNGHKKKQVDVCQLSLKSGPCRANVPSYWYDAMAGQCRPFLYSGCLGNANRFSTEEECLARCSKRSIEIEESERRIPHKTELSDVCFFGNLTLKQGEQLLQTDPCDTCICVTPPRITCTRKVRRDFDSVCQYTFSANQCFPTSISCVSANPPCQDPCRRVLCPDGEQCRVELVKSADGSSDYKGVCGLPNQVDDN